MSTTAVEVPAEESKRTNGLERLASLGVPDSAITSLLIVLGVLTLLPHVGGRDFGPYSLPQLVSVSTFWTIGLGAPLAWVVLLVRSFPVCRASLVRMGKISAFVLALAVFVCFLTAPVEHIERFPVTAAVGHASQEEKVQIPFGQSIELTFESAPSDDFVHLYICSGPTKPDSCAQEQRHAGVALKASVNAGTVRVWLFNYAQNQAPKHGALVVRYTTRRAL